MPPKKGITKASKVAFVNKAHSQARAKTTKPLTVKRTPFRAEYSLPGPPRTVDRPAELEVYVGDDGLPLCLPREANVWDKEVRKNAVAPSNDLLGRTTCLMIHSPDNSRSRDNTALSEAIRGVLGRCPKLTELHWLNAFDVPVVFAHAETPPHLNAQLKKLSLLGADLWHEQLLELTGKLSGLEEIDLRRAISSEGLPWRDIYLPAECHDDRAPWTEPLETFAASCPMLRTIDMRGIIDKWDTFNHCLDDDVILTLAKRGVQLKGTEKKFMFVGR